MPISNHERAGSRPRRRLPAVTVAVAVTLAVTGCSTGGSDDAAPPKKTASASSPSAPATSADPQAAEEQAVLEVYERYWAAQVQAYAKASDSGTDLRKYATGAALARSLSDLLQLDRANYVSSGQPRIAPEVTALTLDRKIPAATISDCLDVTGWVTVNRTTRKTIKRPNVPLKYVVTISAEKWGKQWMITKAEPQGRACEPAASSSPHPPSA